MAEVAAREAGPSAARSGRYRLLLADDSEAVRTLLRILFSLEPRVELVGEAADGRDAVALAERVDADVLILDLAMPLLDGLEVLERLRRTRPSLRVVVYSGLSDPQLVEQARRLGAAEVVVKGAAPEDLIERTLATCRAR